MNNPVLGKIMENVKKHRDTQQTEEETIQQQNQIFHRKSTSNRNEKTQISMNKPVYLGLSILDLSKTVMYELWYDYLKQKYDGNVKLCYMDIDSFIVHVKIDDIYKDNAEDVEKRFDTWANGR